jgi:hypothetical protein
LFVCWPEDGTASRKGAHSFGKALQQQSKADALDAATLLEYLCRMPFVAWVLP